MPDRRIADVPVPPGQDRRRVGGVDWEEGPNVPAAAVFMAKEDVLLFRHTASVAVRFRVRVRMQQADGRIAYQEFEQLTVADRTPQQVTFDPGEGFLLSAAVEPIAGSFMHGQVFVELALLRGLTSAAVVTAALLSEYLQPSFPKGWPAGRVLSSVEGPGVVRAVQGADPAAGVEPSITVPTGARWRVLAFSAQLVTDATAANRFPMFEVNDPTLAANVYRAAPAAAQAASLTQAYQVGPHGVVAAVVNGLVMMPSPVELHVFAGQILRFTTTNIQAGDNWTAPLAIVEEWLETQTQA